MMRLLSRLVAATLLCGMLAACNDSEPQDEIPEGLLTEEDISQPIKRADETESRNGKEGWTCTELAQPEADLAQDTEPESVGVSYWLEAGPYVHSKLLGKSVHYPSIKAGLEALDAALTECLDNQDRSVDGFEKRMDGLPEGAVGYLSSSVERGQPGEMVEKIYAPVGEDQIVVVAVKWDGDEPPVHATDLLPTAMERAED